MLRPTIFRVTSKNTFIDLIGEYQDDLGEELSPHSAACRRKAPLRSRSADASPTCAFTSDSLRLGDGSSSSSSRSCREAHALPSGPPALDAEQGSLQEGTIIASQIDRLNQLLSDTDRTVESSTLSTCHTGTLPTLERFALAEPVAEDAFSHRGQVCPMAAAATKEVRTEARLMAPPGRFSRLSADAAAFVPTCDCYSAGLHEDSGGMDSAWHAGSTLKLVHDREPMRPPGRWTSAKEPANDPLRSSSMERGSDAYTSALSKPGIRRNSSSSSLCSTDVHAEQCSVRSSAEDTPSVMGSDHSETGRSSCTPKEASALELLASEQGVRRGRRQPKEYRHQLVPRRHDFEAEARTREVATLGAGQELDKAPTTLMIKNIPNRYNQADLLADMEELGLSGTFNFFYLPLDQCRRHKHHGCARKTMSNLGYAFVNFVDSKWANRCKAVFQDRPFTRHRLDSRRVAEVRVAHIQGLEANLAHYKQAAVNGAEFQECRPIVHGEPSGAAPERAV